MRPDAPRVRASPARGVLDGLPVAVKGRAGYTAAATAELVARGAVPIGATSTPRGGGYQTWGHTERGPTRNPWRPGLSPGGSSAGSAAAVSAGIVDLATGSDGAGSVRIPAAWCSVIGFKPTSDLAPRTDPTGLAVPGVLVRDPHLLRPWAEAVLETVPASGRGAAVAAWSEDLGFAGPHLDAEVVEIAATAAHQLLTRARVALSGQGMRLRDPEQAWTARRNQHATPAQRRTADELCADNQRELARLFDVVDLLLCPTTPGRAHGHDGPGDHLSVALTWAFNLSGHPAVSVPAGFTADGVPVGLQIIAAPGADAGLLALLEQHVDIAPTAPPTSVAAGARPTRMSR